MRRGRGRRRRRIARLLRCGRGNRLRHGRARGRLGRGRPLCRGGRARRRSRLRRVRAQHRMFLRHGGRRWPRGNARLRRLTGLWRRLRSGRGRPRRNERALCGIGREANLLGIKTLGVLTVSARRRLVHGHERAFAAENAVTVMLLPTIPTRPEIPIFRALVVFLCTALIASGLRFERVLISHCRQGTNSFPSPQFAARRKITDALVPPKPKELDSATLISRLRA